MNNCSKELGNSARSGWDQTLADLSMSLCKKEEKERQDQEIDSRVLIQNALSAINERKHTDFGRFSEIVVTISQI